MFEAVMTDPNQLTQRYRANQSYTLWIDGVGAYLLCLGDQVSIGGPTFGGEGADISLLASLSRCHATVVRTGESYCIEPHSSVSVADRPIYDRTALTNNTEVVLGTNVRLRFRLPSALSISARLDFESHHRPTQSVDGIVLMQDHCLIGPGAEKHVPCRNWEQTVVLFRKDGQFWCRAGVPLTTDGQPNEGPIPIEVGQVVTGPEIRFRLEEVVTL